MAAKRARRGFHSSAHRMTVDDLPEDAKSNILKFVGTDKELLAGYDKLDDLERTLRREKRDQEISRAVLEANNYVTEEAKKGNLMPFRAFHPVRYQELQRSLAMQRALGNYYSMRPGEGSAEDPIVISDNTENAYLKKLGKVAKRATEDVIGAHTANARRLDRAMGISRNQINDINQLTKELEDRKMEEVRIGLRDVDWLRHRR
jgi:hypothetical protein